ncbi:MAG: YIP1 family protein [Chloroflexi bacterium]|nr:YIP1 family protein [Chloroflexota bacterium]
MGMNASSGSLVDRMMRAARLDIAVYEELEHDTTATSQAAMAVGIVAVSGAVGSALGSILFGAGVGVAVFQLIAGIIGAYLGWVIWAYLTYFIGTSLFGGTATPGEMLRTLGFAQSPGILNILGFIPCLGAILALVVAIWSLVCGVVAIRQALDFDTGKAIATAVIAFIPAFIISLVLIGIPTALLAGASGR